jgi:phosphoesterase RecJ-like protein
MKEFLQAKQFIEENKIFHLVGHKNADGDCYGTMVAFCHLIKKLNKNAKMFLADPIPDNYLFLFKNLEVTIANNLDINNIPLIIFECNNFKRSGIDLKNTNKVLNFDHHPGNDFFGSVNVVDTNASSVGEMATFFIKKYYEKLFDKEISNALYTAIHTDTGGFAYSNTTKKTFEACSVLTNHNLDPSFVCTKIYGNKPLHKLKLQGHYLKTLTVIKNGLIGFGAIYLKDLKKFNCQKNDTENFGGFAREIKGVEVGIFALELEENVFKLSIRSKGKIIVNQAAKKFGGGGHKFAAGCVVKGSLNEIIENVSEEILKCRNT